MDSESILISIGVRVPASNRVKSDADPSVKTGSAADARQSETHAGRAILHHYRREGPCSYTPIRTAGLHLILAQNRLVRMAQNPLKLL